MKIALLGDVAFFGKNSIKKNSNLFDYYKDVKDYLSDYDVVIANLETPFNNGNKPYGHKSAYIDSDIENVEILTYLGVSIVNLANNHIYDYGKKSYDLTKKILNENKIEFFGIEQKQVFINSENNKIALSGYCCYSTNPLGIGSNKINELNYSSVQQNLANNTKNNYNNILSIHAGIEHVNFPSYDHIKFARELTKIAPYVYYGHHPHVLQGVEKYNESVIAYSLGNFCFDDVYTARSKEPLVRQTENNKSSIILELEYDNNILIAHKTIPVYSGNENMVLGSEQIEKELDEYSDKLNLGEIEYTNMRNILLNSLKSKVISKRNFNWYFKRISFRTIFVLRDLFLNKYKYKSNFKKYIK